jgi:hypothetical protein
MSKTLAFLGLLAFLGTGGVSAAPTDGPDVRRVGKTVTLYRDDLARAVVSTKYLDAHLDRAWTVVEIGVAAETGKPVVIDRGDVSLVARDGTVIPLPSQKEMAEGLPDVRNVLQTAHVYTDPIGGYLPFSNRERKLKFFTIPGEGVVLDEEVVTTNAAGRAWLFFRSPSGAWKGEYQLVIRNKDLNIRLPFRLPATDFPGKEADRKVVPW